MTQGEVERDATPAPAKQRIRLTNDRNSSDRALSLLIFVAVLAALAARAC